MEPKDRIEMPIYVTDEHGNNRQVDSLVFVRERTCKQSRLFNLVWSECSSESYEWHGNELPSYCPNCGAKVLRNTPKNSETGAKVVGE